MKPSLSPEIGMSKEKSQRGGPWEGIKGRRTVMKIKSRNEDQLLGKISCQELLDIWIESSRQVWLKRDVKHKRGEESQFVGIMPCKRAWCLTCRLYQEKLLLPELQTVGRNQCLQQQLSVAQGTFPEEADVVSDIQAGCAFGNKILEPTHFK